METSIESTIRNSSEIAKRWIVIFVVASLNISNATLWLSYASVANAASKYYGVNESSIDWFALVFLISTVLTGGFSVWLTDRKGLRTAVLIGAWLNASGGLIRLLDRFAVSYPMAFCGQMIASLAQPFLFCLATKVSEEWFPQKQRTMATTIIVMANPVGQLLASGITPLFSNANNDCGIPCMNLAWTIPSIVCAIAATLLIRNSKPEYPPNDSATVTMDYPYSMALKMLLTSKAFLLLMFGVGSILGLSALFMSCMEEMLCAKGYDNEFSGYCSIALIGFGLIGAFISGIYADRKRTFIGQLKISLTLMTLSFSFFIIVTRYADMGYLVLISSGLFGFCAFSGLPVGLELAALYCFQIIPEATSTGLILICGQLQGLLYILFHDTLKAELSPDLRPIEKCSHLTSYRLGARNIVPSDDTRPILIVCGFIFLFETLFVLFFSKEYKRNKSEKTSPVSHIFGDDDDQDDLNSQASPCDDSFTSSLYS